MQVKRAKSFLSGDSFPNEDLSFRPHARSSTVLDIFKHQLLSERRFFGEFLGVPEPPASEVLPQQDKRGEFAQDAFLNLPDHA